MYMEQLETLSFKGQRELFNHSFVEEKFMYLKKGISCYESVCFVL